MLKNSGIVVRRYLVTAGDLHISRAKSAVTLDRLTSNHCSAMANKVLSVSKVAFFFIRSLWVLRVHITS